MQTTLTPSAVGSAQGRWLLADCLRLLGHAARPSKAACVEDLHSAAQQARPLCRNYWGLCS